MANQQVRPNLSNPNSFIPLACIVVLFLLFLSSSGRLQRIKQVWEGAQQTAVDTSANDGTVAPLSPKIGSIRKVVDPKTPNPIKGAILPPATWDGGYIKH